LGNVTEETRRQVLLAADAKALLNRYSTSFTHTPRHCWLKGASWLSQGCSGPAFGKMWWRQSARAARFIASLLQKDEGKLLAYYHLVARLRVPNQQFLTRSATRLKTFLEAFCLQNVSH
jgi:hypothetical protein